MTDRAATRRLGVACALIFAAAAAFAVADYRPLRGAPWCAPVGARQP